LAFDADLKLAEYKFPRNAEVYLEAHRQNLWMQFNWGTVSLLRPPAVRHLTDFDVPDGILFRVRVVQPPGTEHHKLLGEADAVPFMKVGEATVECKPLLETVPDALDEMLWKLDIDSDPPRLLVNKDAHPTWKGMARSVQFISLVYPEVLRRLLTVALIERKVAIDDEDDGWESDWLRFARNLGTGSPPLPSDKSGCELWIENAVSAFARKHQLKMTWNLGQSQGEQ
jgi:hypothetical protein